MSSRSRHDHVARYFSENGADWQATYATRAPIGHTVAARLRCCAALLGDMTGRRLLDLGCGDGVLLSLVGPVLSAYDGIDRSSTMVDATRVRIQALHLGPGFNVRVGDVERLPFPADHFDAVVALGLLGFVDDPSTTIREALRVARPGARLVFSTARRSSVDRWILTGTQPIRAALRLVTGRGSSRPPVRAYGDADFQRLLAAAGCLVLKATYYDKRVLPYPLGRVWPRLAYRSAELLEGCPALNACATGCLVLCAKGSTT